MSGIVEFASEKLESIKAALKTLEVHVEKLLGHEDPAVKAIGEDVAKTVDSLKADAGHLESVAVGDAGQVAHDVETEGVHPAEVAAVADVAELGAEAVHDVETAVTEAVHPAPAEAVAPVEAAPVVETPATPTA
jgi:hypothetical protein